MADSRKTWADMVESEEQELLVKMSRSSLKQTKEKENNQTSTDTKHKYETKRNKTKLNPYQRGIRDGLQSLIKETPYQIGYRHGRKQGNSEKK
jgi:hypothetical protein